MSNKLKVAVAISSHSPAFFTKLTVGSLIKNEPNCDLNIHIGYHSNLSDYTKDFSMFTDLSDWCQFHAVDEINWNIHNENLYRYSLMHSVNLQNIFKNVQYYDFDYLVILDNDVYVKKEFIHSLINKYPTTDLIGTFFNDNVNQTAVTTMNGEIHNFAPKLSVWNMIISKKLFNKIIKQSSIIEPAIINNVVYDTFARILYLIKTEWLDIKLGILSTKEMEEYIQHFFTSSFNYGITKNKGSIDLPLQIYNQTFPNGVYEYLKTNYKPGI